MRRASESLLWTPRTRESKSFSYRYAPCSPPPPLAGDAARLCSPRASAAASRLHVSALPSQASSKDTGQLAAALHHRILALRSRAEQESESRPEVTAPPLPQSNEEDSEEDDVLIGPSSGTTPSAGNVLLFSYCCVSVLKAGVRSS